MTFNLNAGYFKGAYFRFYSALSLCNCCQLGMQNYKLIEDILAPWQLMDALCCLCRLCYFCCFLLFLALVFWVQVAQAVAVCAVQAIKTVLESAHILFSLAYLSA